MKKLLLIFLILPTVAMGETWVCKQHYPKLSYDSIYKFEIQGNKIKWHSAAGNILQIYSKTDSYIFAIDDKYLPAGNVYSLILSRPDMYFVLNQNDAGGVFKDPKNFKKIDTRFSGLCIIE
jgi:hypothetical protein